MMRRQLYNTLFGMLFGILALLLVGCGSSGGESSGTSTDKDESTTTNSVLFSSTNINASPQTSTFSTEGGDVKFILNHEGESDGAFTVQLWSMTDGKTSLLANKSVKNHKIIEELPSGDYFFEVEADGSWSIKVEGDSVAIPPVPEIPHTLLLELFNKEGQKTRYISENNPGTLRITVKTAKGEPVAFEELEVTTTKGAFLNSDGTAITDEEGVSEFFTLTASGANGAGSISVSGGYYSPNVPFAFQINPPSSTEPVIIEAALLDGNGNPTPSISEQTPRTLKITVTNDGTPAVNQFVTATTTKGAFLNSDGTAITDTDGNAEFTLIADGDVGAGTIDVTVGVNSLETPLVFQIAAPPSPIPDTIAAVLLDSAGNPTTSISEQTSRIFRVTVTTADGTPAVNQFITATTTKGAFLNSDGTAITDAAGNADLTLIADGDVGAGIIDVTVGVNSLETPLVFQIAAPPSPVPNTIVAVLLDSAGNPTTSISEQTSRILRVTVTTADGTPAVNQFITATTTKGAFLNSDGTAITDAAGNAELTLITNGDVGAGTINVTVGVNSLETPLVFQIDNAIVVGTVTLSANLTSIPADGVSSSAISARVTDTSGTSMPQGTAVIFTTSLGQFSNGGTSQTVSTTDSSGSVTVSLISATTSGFAQVTATSGGVTQRTIVSFEPEDAPQLWEP